jgi:META domain/Kazal-type serine protease inhibitor domain
MRICFILFSLLLLNCTKENNNNDCVGEPNQDCICTEQYQPVCGCNGITYGNNCFASCEGISEVIEGECPITNEKLIDNWIFMGWQKKDAIDINKIEKKHNFSVNLNMTNTKNENDAFAYSGKAAVNLYGGIYTVGLNKQLSIDGGFSTKIGGSIEEMQFESNYHNSLRATTKFIVVDDKLLLEFKEGENIDHLIYIKQ